MFWEDFKGILYVIEKKEGGVEGVLDNKIGDVKYVAKYGYL